MGLFYKRIELKKFNWPVELIHTVVFFKNRKEPFIAYHQDGQWYDEEGQEIKTPSYYLKEIPDGDFVKEAVINFNKLLRHDNQTK
jgi:hypothetical protein